MPEGEVAELPSVLLPAGNIFGGSGLMIQQS
jgi:hypothetical protein